MLTADSIEFATQLLFNWYKQLRGKDIDEILAINKVTVKTMKYGKAGAQALLVKKLDGGYQILIADFKKSPQFEIFLKYHELAHLLMFNLNRPFGDNEYWSVECWCDSFALAMMFWQIGHEAMTEGSYKNFLQDGIGLRKKKYERHFARRILALCRAASVAGYTNIQPLVKLSREIVRVSKK